MNRTFVAILLLALTYTAARGETPEEWVLLGTRVHGGFGSFVPLGIRIGLDATQRLKAKPRELSITYYDSDKSPCACFADGIAIATHVSVGQRTLTVASEKAPDNAIAVVVVRLRSGGPGLKYTIPVSALSTLGSMNARLNPRGRYDAVMRMNGLFEVVPIP